MTSLCVDSRHASSVVTSVLAMDNVSSAGTNKFMRSRIKQLREEKGWSMRELAARANTTSSTINKLEKGITRLNTDWLVRLSTAFGVELEELVKASDSKSVLMQQDDVEPVEPQDAGDLTGFVTVMGDPEIAKKNAYLGGHLSTQSRYIVKSDVLDQIGIYPNSILITDDNPEEIGKIKTGSIVIVRLRDEGRESTILRQFLAPSILVTNSSVQSPPVINMRLQAAVITGVVVSSIRRHTLDSGA